MKSDIGAPDWAMICQSWKTSLELLLVQG